jgi:hypothetical protein
MVFSYNLGAFDPKFLPKLFILPTKNDMEIQAWHDVAPYPTIHPLATQNPKPTNHNLHNLIVTHTTEQKILEHSTLNSNFTTLS